MKGDMYFDDVVTYANGEATLNLDFGLAVMQGTTDKTAKAPTGLAPILGVILHSHVYDNGPNGQLVTGGAQPGLKPGAHMGIMNKGRVWVKVEEAVLVNDPAFVRVLAGTGGSILGSFRKSADNLLAVPVNAAFTAGAGTLAAGTYAYRVTALTAAGGETSPSAETTFVAGAGTGINVNWGAVAGATGYKIYGRLANGQEQFLAQVGAVTTWLDNGSLTPAGLPPTANTAGTAMQVKGRYRTSAGAAGVALLEFNYEVNAG